jgi:hypothetical protein
MTRFQKPLRQICRRPNTQMHSSHSGTGLTLRSAGRQDTTAPARQRGAAVVEFALILPILLAMLVGGIDASLALYDKAVITNASREGARAGIVARNPLLSDAQIQQVVNQYTQSALVSLGANTADPEVDILKITLPNGDPALQVTVAYDFQGIGLGSLLQSLGRPIKLKASTVMVYE